MSSLAIQQIIRDVRDPRTLRLVMVVVVVACSPPRPPLTGHAPGVIDAHVLGPSGPVADAIVEVVALRPHGCPCPVRDASLESLASEDAPACQCPAAAAMWLGVLEQCALPGALAVARGDAHGEISVPVIAGSTLVVSGGAGSRRLALPDLRTGLALELSATRSPRVKLNGDPRDLRAAVVLEDGYCVPLRRRGDTWQPERPIPEDEQGVIVARNRSGFAATPVDFLDPDPTITIHPTRSISGTCTNASTAVLDGAFQHLTTPVDPSGRFGFASVLGFDADIRCLDLVGGSEPLFYRAEDGRVSVTGTIDASERCTPVEVVEPSGAPISAAELIDRDSGTYYATDEHGRACLLSLGSELEVSAPVERGGKCAGHTRLAVPTLPPSPVRLTLEIRRLSSVTVTGRVLSPEHLPVADAMVDVEQLAPSVTGCSEGFPAQATTALDGTFTLTVPRGKLALRVHHRWYLDHRVETDGSGSRVSIVLERGATWHGRMLAPDGSAIEHCRVSLARRGQSEGRASCSAAGFALTVLGPGKATLELEVEDHPILGERRRMSRSVTIAADEHRRADLRWPAGALIAGVVVDLAGAPIAGVRLRALPVGTDPDPTRSQANEVVVKADAAGRFAFHDMRAGVWTIHTYHPSVDVALDASAGTTDLRVVIAPQP